MNEMLRAIEQEQLKNEVPNFGPGDTVKVHVRIIEGKRKNTSIRRCSIKETRWRSKRNFHS